MSVETKNNIQIKTNQISGKPEQEPSNIAANKPKLGAEGSKELDDIIATLSALDISSPSFGPKSTDSQRPKLETQVSEPAVSSANKEPEIEATKSSPEAPQETLKPNIPASRVPPKLTPISSFQPAQEKVSENKLQPEFLSNLLQEYKIPQDATSIVFKSEKDKSTQNIPIDASNVGALQQVNKLLNDGFVPDIYYNKNKVPEKVQPLAKQSEGPSLQQSEKALDDIIASLDAIEIPNQVKNKSPQLDAEPKASVQESTSKPAALTENQQILAEFKKDRGIPEDAKAVTFTKSKGFGLFKSTKTLDLNEENISQIMVMANKWRAEGSEKTRTGWKFEGFVDKNGSSVSLNSKNESKEATANQTKAQGEEKQTFQPGRIATLWEKFKNASLPTKALIIGGAAVAAGAVVVGSIFSGGGLAIAAGAMIGGLCGAAGMAKGASMMQSEYTETFAKQEQARVQKAIRGSFEDKSAKPDSPSQEPLKTNSHSADQNSWTNRVSESRANSTSVNQIH